MFVGFSWILVNPKRMRSSDENESKTQAQIYLEGYFVTKLTKVTMAI